MSNKIFTFLAIMAFSPLMGNAFQKFSYTDTLQATKLIPFGRTLLNGQNNLELISSASHFKFRFKGTQCIVFMATKNKNDHNYIQYELDGVYQKRLRIDGNNFTPVVIKVANPGEHIIVIYKTTEAHTGPVIISKVVAKNVKSVAEKKAPLIEFIGNSITCGAAADASEFPCGTGDYHDQHNGYMAYGPRVARALGINFLMSSVSGIGVYRTWNLDGPSMPQVYENIDFQLNNPMKWNFKHYTPQIVSIALGTNDLSNGDGKNDRKPFNEQIFIANYVDFIKLVKSKYPQAQIALLSSPMVKGSAREELQKCLTIVKAKTDALYPASKPVANFFFEPMNARGCSGHPSVEDHLLLANQLKPFYQSLLK